MKKCPYCGKEYPDEATTCLIDDELLLNNPQSPISNKQEVETLLGKNEPYLSFPDYKWSAKDAWKCLGMIFLALIIMVFILVVIIFALHFPTSISKNFEKNGFDYCSISILSCIIFLLPAIYFARTKTCATFLSGFGLDCKITNYAWFGVIMALIIRCHGHYYGWGGVSNRDIVSYENTVGVERYFFLVPLVLLAPFFEEVVNRGFLYKAFRGSYSVEVSMALIVIWTALNHWQQYHSSSLAFDLSALTVVQCYLREKSNSLWDCILCHFTYNGSLLVVSALK